MIWEAPRLWPGGTAFIIGGGPSILDMNLSLIHSKRVIAVNNAYGDPVYSRSNRLRDMVPRPWVDVLWFGDQKWWKWHHEFIRRFPGLVASCCESDHIKANRRIRALARERGKPHGLSEDPSTVCWNHNSGASAVNLAFHFGCDRVVLVGFDMRIVDGRKNYHQDHIEKPHDPFLNFRLSFQDVVIDANRLGLEIINATPESSIQGIPFVPLEELV